MLLRILLPVGSAVVALLCTELVLRAFDLAPTDGVFTANADEFESQPGIFAPNQDVTDRRIPELPHRVRIDSLGFRGDAFPRRKPASEVRILFVGDSFTYGDFVNDEETLPAQVEASLSATCSRPVRAINAGVGGSTIVGQSRLIDRGLELHPDVVVLVFSENDVTDLVGTPLWERLTANRALKSSFPMSWVYPALRGSAMWNLALRARAVWRAGQQARTAEESPVEPAPSGPAELDRRGERERYIRHLLEAQKLVTGAGLSFIFAVYPSHHTVYDEAPTADSDRAWVMDAAIGSGIQTVDLLPVLRDSEASAEQLYLLPHDGHPSPLGYALTASVIAEELTSIPVLAVGCEGWGFNAAHWRFPPGF